MAGSTSSNPVWPWEEEGRDRMEYLFDTKYQSDTVLYIGPQKQEVRVHRFILEFSSPVFHNIFQEGSGGQMNIENVDPTIFNMFLRHLYLRESGDEVSVQNCFPLLEIATRYQVRSLIHFCSNKLNGNITNQNVITLLQQAMEFGQKELTEATLNYFCRNVREFLDSAGFYELRENSLCEILKRDDLQVESELQLFNAVLRWGEAECRRQKLDSNDPENLRKSLTNVLSLIRFPVMEAEEFTLNVAMKKVLSQEDMTAMFLFFTVSVEKRAMIPQGRFNASPRNYTVQPKPKPVGRTTALIQSTSNLSGRIFVASRSERDGNYERAWIHEPPESLEFKTDKPIVLVGLKLVHPPNHSMNFSNPNSSDFTDLAISVSINQSTLFGPCLLRETKKPFDLFHLMSFERPVEVTAKSWYSITAFCSGNARLWDERTQTSSTFVFNRHCYITEGLLTSCNVQCEEEGQIEKVCFEFRRGGRTLPFDWGCIDQLIFKTVKPPPKPYWWTDPGLQPGSSSWTPNPLNKVSR